MGARRKDGFSGGSTMGMADFLVHPAVMSRAAFHNDGMEIPPVDPGRYRDMSQASSSHKYY